MPLHLAKKLAIRGPHGIHSSHLVKMAEAALDEANPYWRRLSAQKRQDLKDDMMAAIFAAAEKVDAEYNASQK